MRGLVSLLLITTITGCTTGPEVTEMTNFYDIEVNRISGETIPLEEYRGKVLLIVNTASRCGFTGQYEGLQELYENYGERGLVVLGFPSNDFMKQEPGSNDDIAAFCEANYSITFPMFEKISVKGDDRHPLYTFLTSGVSNPDTSGKISWNFNKFLISKEGEVIARFGSRTKPDSSKLIDTVEGALE